MYVHVHVHIQQLQYLYVHAQLHVHAHVRDQILAYRYMYIHNHHTCTLYWWLVSSALTLVNIPPKSLGKASGLSTGDGIRRPACAYMYTSGIRAAFKSTGTFVNHSHAVQY